MSVSKRLEPVFAALLRASEAHKKVTLDELAAALEPWAATHDEIDALIGALEEEGREVGGTTNGVLPAALRAVLDSARDLTGMLGRRPTVPEIALRAGLPVERVRQALAFARVLQR